LELVLLVAVGGAGQNNAGTKCSNMEDIVKGFTAVLDESV
jgi:hypothetical protein